MTREEALEVLTSPIVTGLRSGKRIISEAMNVAIKALQTEPCEDAISRQDARNCITGNEFGWRMVQDLDKLPSVQPKLPECEDAVSRSFMKELGAECIAVRDERGVLVAIASIDLLPSVQPKAKTVPVVYTGDGYADGNIVFDIAVCQSCGYEYEDGDKDWKEPFCPHCGQALKWAIEESE